MAIKSRFGQLLVQKKVVDESTLEQALAIQDEDPSNPRRIEEILVTEFNIDHHSIYGLMAELYASRAIRIDLQKLTNSQIEQTKHILTQFNVDFKKKLLFKKILPFRLFSENKTLMVLTCDVTEKTIEKIPEYSEYAKYEVVYCPLRILDELIKTIEPQKNEFLELLQEVGDQVDQTDEKTSQAGLDEYAIDEEINKSLLVNLFEGCLLEGVRKGASDVHIIPAGKSSVDIYFRLDGKLNLWHRQENTSPEAMCAVVKDRSTGVDRFERDTAQDGFAQRIVDGHLIRFRISIIPITSAEFERRFESVVIRIIDDRNVITDLKKLGFQPQAEKDFFTSIGKSKGIVIVTGPTGSGKSTTLMAALYQTITPEKNVLTVEDPVEYAIKGARQLKIGGKMSFDQAIRAILRHDPDIVMVGEIRDKKTAEVAIKLANTGHLTFSTLHTNDAPSAVSRLYKMGLEPFLLANVINIIVAQRLVRKLCQHCKVPLPKDDIEKALEFGVPSEAIQEGLVYASGGGCSKCTNGYKGRVNICEALYFSPEVRKAVLESGHEIDEDRIRAVAEGQGMLSMKESGIDRMAHGLTTLEEVTYATSVD